MNIYNKYYKIKIHNKQKLKISNEKLKKIDNY